MREYLSGLNKLSYFRLGSWMTSCACNTTKGRVKMRILSKNQNSEYSLNDWSEFGPDGYEQADVIRSLNDTLYHAEVTGTDDYDVRVKDRFVLCFNESYRTQTSSRKSDWEVDILSGFPERRDGFYMISFLDTDDGQPGVQVESHMKQLFDAAHELVTQYIYEKVLYKQDTANRYLDAFFSLSKEAIFSVNNYNLATPQFRKSFFLRDLLTLMAKRHPFPERAYGRSVKSSADYYYQFSIYDVFAYDVLQRSLQAASVLYKELPCSGKRPDKALRALRCDLFLGSVQSAFRRLVCLDQTIYRVEMNRHNSKLLAIPYDDLSSTNETKPIRLFEKTATYIRNNMNTNLKDLKVSVCIIGHTESSVDSKERTLADLAMALLNWYNRLSLEDEQKPRLELSILNYVNERDWPECNYLNKRTDFICEEGEHRIDCTIKLIDYTREFGFNTVYLKKLIDENDLVYLLDCPWLSTENFEVKKGGSLDAFCYALRDKERTVPTPENLLDSKFQAFYTEANMRQLDQQYNRVTSSATNNAGEIVRVMKDSQIRNIQRIVKNQSSEKHKELYIFSSERDGINYSNISSYPLTRQERYDGKVFTIIQFKNTPSARLKYDKSGRVHLLIPLWSILKYDSISFAYCFFKDALNECLEDVSCDPIHYFELYRNILIVINATPSSLQSINVSLLFSDGADSCLEAIKAGSSNKAVKKRVEDLVVEFVKALFEDGIFSKENRYGHDAMRTGLLMNLSSAVKTVNEMLFLHKLRMAFMNGKQDAYEVNVDSTFQSEPLPRVNTEFKGTDFFMDKKLYDRLMLTLENSPQLTIAMRAMLNESSDYFGERDILRTILTNICAACERSRDTDSRLYKNVIECLKEA